MRYLIIDLEKNKSIQLLTELFPQSTFSECILSEEESMAKFKESYMRGWKDRALEFDGQNGCTFENYAKKTL